MGIQKRSGSDRIRANPWESKMPSFEQHCRESEQADRALVNRSRLLLFRSFLQELRRFMVHQRTRQIDRGTLHSLSSYSSTLLSKL